MDSYRTDFNVRANVDANKQIELDGLHLAHAGVSNGRNAHHLAALGKENGLGGNKSKNNGADMLDIILAYQPPYEELFSETLGNLRDAQAQAEALRAQIEAALQDATRKHDDLLERAVILPDGRRAFLDADGHAYTDGGERLEAATTEGIDWTGRPTRDDFLRSQERIASLEAAQGTHQALEARLGEIDHRLADPDDRPSRDELEGFQKEIDGITEEIETVRIAVESASISVEHREHDSVSVDLAQQARVPVL